MQVYDPSHLVGRAETELYDTRKFTGKSELDKEDFLTLLVAQLQHQDPLNPMDDKEFTAQIAEFSSLEQLTNISDGIDEMNSQTGTQDMVSAVNFIGRDVVADGSGLSIRNGEPSSLFYSLGSTAASAYINIYDPNGNLVRTDQLGGKQAGVYEYEWDGKDWQGKDLPDGLYSIGMAAEGPNGQPVLVETQVSGEVVGVQSHNGRHYLRLADGRVVDFLNVYEVVDPDSRKDGSGEEEPEG
jgi:flagellar basal-body rod modification protein FlgD